MVMMNRSILFASAAALSLTACVAKDQPPTAIERAIPTADQVKIKLPVNNRAIGELAEWYVATRNITQMFNGGSAWVLILVHTIVQYPVTTVDGDKYTWGPFAGDGLDPAEYKLDVTDNGDGSYQWDLSGRGRGQSDFTVVINGLANTGAQDPDLGNGSFRIDFEAGRKVNPIDADPNARGTIDVGYDLAQRHLDLDIATIGDNNQPITATYSYDEAADGSGAMTFEIDGDMGDGPAKEHAAVVSKWLRSGAGRANVAARGGDITAEVAGSQCWNDRFVSVYEAFAATDGQQAFAVSDGQESACEVE